MTRGVKDDSRLTDEQRNRAARAAYVPELAAEQAARWRNDAYLDEMLGHAMHAYLYAAKRFDPNLSWNGEKGWPAFALRCVRLALSSRKESVKAKIKTARAERIMAIDPPSHLPGPYRIAAAKEAASIALAAMTDRQREATLLKASGANLCEEGRLRGLSRSALRISAIDGAKRAVKAIGWEEA